jgi:hydroxypyruvate reductase
LARVIGSRLDAVAGARAAAVARGYHPIVLGEPVQGEARSTALAWWQQVQHAASGARRPACVISAGETTVRVIGRGIGGRNLEFALALAEPLGLYGADVAAASVGTDGIDGPSGVAGAVVDSTTFARAARLGLEAPTRYLDANDSLAFFAALDDVIRLGRTDTNVGDLQVLLIDSGTH